MHIGTCMYLHICAHDITPIIFNSENAKNSLQTCRSTLSRTACRIERKRLFLSEVLFLSSLLLCNFRSTQLPACRLIKKRGGTKTKNQKEVRYATEDIIKYEYSIYIESKLEI